MSEQSTSRTGHGSSEQEQPRSVSGRRAGDSVLIISDDAEFARIVVARWQSQRIVPAFTLMGSDLYSSAVLASHTLTILGPRVNHLPKVLKAIEAAGDAVICVAPEQSMPMRELRGMAMFIRHTDGWLEDLIQLASEVLRRSDAGARMRLAELALAASQRHAILGRYLLEMRHTLNNCLTSVLGNAELLLLEPGRLAADTREQIETMHTMALRIHEIFQRFSSLETEMQFAERKSQTETDRQSQVVAAS